MKKLLVISATLMVGAMFTACASPIASTAQTPKARVPSTVMDWSTQPDEMLLIGASGYGYGPVVPSHAQSNVYPDYTDYTVFPEFALVPYVPSANVTEQQPSSQLPNAQK